MIEEEDTGTGVLIANTAVGPVILVTGVRGLVEQEVADAIARSHAAVLGVPVFGLWLLPEGCPEVSHAEITVRAKTFGAG